MDFITLPQVLNLRIGRHNPRHLPYIFIGDFTAAQRFTSEYIAESLWALEDDEREIRERRSRLEVR